MINPTSYYTVQGWMISELGLKGNALAAYAIIYGFSQDGVSEYAGSSRYLCEWLGCSKKTILTVLAELTEKGFLSKKTILQNGVTLCNYVAVRPVQSDSADPGVKITPPEKNLHQGGVKITPPPEKKLHQGGENITPHISRDNNREINIEIKESISAPAAPDAPPPPEEEKKEPVKHHHGEYKKVMLTNEELDKLKAEFPKDWKERIESLDAYIASKGAKYKSHYVTIRNWAKRDEKEQQAKAQAPATRGRPRSGTVGPNGVVYDPSKTDLDKYFRGGTA